MSIERSERLHRDVRRYAASGEYQAGTFHQMATRIADFQAEFCEGSRRLRQSSLVPGPLPGVEMVPVDAFRFTNVFAFDPAMAEATFLTSGTTSGRSGRHFMRTTETYTRVALNWGKHALLSKSGTRTLVVALMPDPGPRGSSSLCFMAQAFMDRFDGPPTARATAGYS